MSNQRVIKFRAWNDFNKQMIPEYVRFEQQDGCIAANIQKPEVCRITSVMQFTDFIDKNGKEIFEGDIVGWYSIQSGALKTYRVDVVEWAGSGFLLMPWVHELEWAAMEIIGNIFENPGLNPRKGADDAL